MRKTLCRLLIAACLASPVLAMAKDEDIGKLTEAARKLSTQLLTQVRGELVRELENGGPLRAIAVCKFSAPEITASVSRQSGSRVTRVSLKPRNRANGEPDVWEQQVLLDFEKRVANGEKAENLEYAAIVQEPLGRYFRYAKAIPMIEVCSGCHGSRVSEAVKALLAAEYPYDKAVGLSSGQVRGAVSVKQPL
jgi:hypothetical protein